MTHDLVIRGGSVIDGSGRPPVTADIAVEDGVITVVGRVDGFARRTLEADGLLVTPGFVDIHTHYDGQVTWDDMLTPSCWHGVTTAIMGNCGVGFAPCQTDRREWLIALMEAVEEIPGTALHDGIDWRWESFPEFIDHLSGLHRAIDFGAQVAHGPLRAFVMGDRGAQNHRATAEDIENMARLTRNAMDAGALGFSMSRTYSHQTPAGDYVPGTLAEIDEILGVAGVLGEVKRGVIEVTPLGVIGEDLEAVPREMAWMRQLAADTGRPVTFALVQHAADPDAWRVMLDLARDARREGANVVPQVHGRAPMVLTGLNTLANPFRSTATWQTLESRSSSEIAQRIQTDTTLRLRLVAEVRAQRGNTFDRALGHMFPLGDPPDYEPKPSRTLTNIGRRTDRDPLEVMLDEMASHDGTGLINRPFFNYEGGSLDVVKAMLNEPGVVVGLGDAGAHCATICDASLPTWMLAHWCRDRPGPQIPLEQMVRMLTLDPATLYGLGDRGAIAPGMKADLNLIDFEALRVEAPELVADLPTGASRFVQRSVGYESTLVSGVVTFDRGVATGALPGRLVGASHRAAHVPSAPA